MREINLEQLQLLVLEMMVDIDGVCRANGITYYLAWGTLLGAVREKGFIGWDDDIDIWMRREDFVRFREIYQKRARQGYFLQTNESDLYCPVPEMMRVCIDDTCYWPEEMVNKRFHRGIYLDIFPLDYAYKDLSRSKKLFDKLTKYHSLLFRKCLGGQGRNKLKSRIYDGLLRITPFFMLKSLIMSSMNVCARIPKSERLVNYTSTYSFERSNFLERSFREAIECDFCGHDFLIPAGYDEVLTVAYGSDYMTPKRTSKHETLKAFVEVSG